MKEFHSFRVQERATGARLVIIGVFLLLVGAFFRTQVLDYDRFRLRAESNRLRPVPLQPARGTIYDRQGQIIAETVPGYSVALLASSTDSLRQVLDRFNKIVPVDSDAGRNRPQPLPGGPLSAGPGAGERNPGAGLAAGRAPRRAARSGDPVASRGESIPAPERSPTWWAMSAR